jgi:uncharacterized membrane protein
MNTPASLSPDNAEAPGPQVRPIGLARPLAWLRLGYQDLLVAPGPSLLHGLLVALGGLVVLTLTLRIWPLMPGALSGFLLVGPILCTGLYELSRRRALGEKPRLSHVFTAWRRGTRPLVALGLLLFVAATAWVAVSALLFKLFLREPIATPLDLLRYAVVGQGTLLFWLWLLAGALGAALVFALTAVSAPLLLDRQVNLRVALLASVRAVGDNPLPMALWGALIMLATILSMATLMMGFIFAVPLIGHATWHAYRDLLDAGALPQR